MVPLPIECDDSFLRRPLERIRIAGSRAKVVSGGQQSPSVPELVRYGYEETGRQVSAEGVELQAVGPRQQALFEQRAVVGKEREHALGELLPQGRTGGRH